MADTTTRPRVELGPGDIVIGVDSHADTWVLAALDHNGRLLATHTVDTTLAGADDAVTWATGHGTARLAGVEGTGDYAIGLAAHLADHGIIVVEVNRPNRARRRRKGKTDTLDAENAARAALSGDAAALPKDRSGLVEVIRVLRTTRASAVAHRTAILNQVKDLVVSAPLALRDELRHLSNKATLDLTATWPTTGEATPDGATRLVLAHLGRRYQALNLEIKALDKHLKTLIEQAAPRTIAHFGVGPITAAQLLITAGQNIDRLHDEASFAALTGVSPIEASSGKNVRRRLNRGGDRQANSALWTIANVRRRGGHEPTIAYIAKRRALGKTDKEILRNIKRYIARQLFPALKADLANLPHCNPLT